MKKTFQFKLYRSKRGKRLHRQINIASGVYNHCIALHKRYYRLFGKSLNKYQLQKHLTKLKKQAKYQHWKQLGSQAIQDTTDRIDRAYKLFFDSLKSGRKVSPPNFKKRIKYKSFTLKQAGYKLLSDNKIRIGKTIYKYFRSREIEGQIKTLTIKRDPLGDIRLFFSCDLPDIQTNQAATGKMAGFDFGLKTFLISNETTKIQSPEFFKQNVKKLKAASRELSSKREGSNNRYRAKLNLARVHRKTVNQRKDFFFKLSKELCSKYDCVFFEDLNLKGMQKLWGKKISDLAFSEFLKILEHQGLKYGCQVKYIDRFYPSSKTCHVCGYIKADLELKERVWRCPTCGNTHDRDENAAINIYREGASSLGLGDVRPMKAVSA